MAIAHEWEYLAPYVNQRGSSMGSLLLRGLHLIDDLRNDIRFALRSLRKHILLSTTVVITLAFGLGLNTGVFTLINATLFRAHVEDAETFFRVHAYYSDRFVQGLVSLPDYQAYLAGTRSVRTLAAWDDVYTTLGARAPVTVRVALASCNFFSVYGLERPESGRFFLANECSLSGSGPVAVVSDELWRSQFDADTHILGRVIRVGRTALTIVGVTPPRFSGREKGVNIWIPYTMLSQFENEPWLMLEGRLNPGYSRADAQAEFSVIAQQQDRLHPSRKTTLIVTDGSMIAEPHLRMAIWVVSSIMGALTLVLLISCTNVSALLLSRASARKREISIRLSLGAGRVLAAARDRSSALTLVHEISRTRVSAPMIEDTTQMAMRKCGSAIMEPSVTIKVVFLLGCKRSCCCAITLNSAWASARE